MDSYASMTLGSTDRNAEKLGAFVAWLIINDLIEPRLQAESGTSLTRVRMHDLTGADFLSAVLHGELKPEHLTDTGRTFTEHYLVGGQYDADYASLTLEGEDEWHHYDQVAPLITRAFRAHRGKGQSAARRMTARILQFPGRK